MLLIKKFNSTTAALASEHSEVRPCESWCILIRRRQILPCWEGAGQGGTAAAHRPSWKGWHSAYSGIWPTLLLPISPLSGVTGSQSGGKSQGLSCPRSSWERENRTKQGIKAGFRLSAAGIGSGSMSTLPTSCHRVLSHGRTLQYRVCSSKHCSFNVLQQLNQTWYTGSANKTLRLKNRLFLLTIQCNNSIFYFDEARRVVNSGSIDWMRLRLTRRKVLENCKARYVTSLFKRLCLIKERW